MSTIFFSALSFLKNQLSNLFLSIYIGSFGTSSSNLTSSPSPFPLSSVYLTPFLSLSFFWVGIFQPLVFIDIWNSGCEWQWNMIICHHSLLCPIEKELPVTSRIFPSFVTLSQMLYNCLTTLSSPIHLKLAFLGISHVFHLLLLWDIPVTRFPHPAM